MGELVAENTISPFMAILWCFYPVAFVVGLELFLRAENDDDCLLYTSPSPRDGDDSRIPSSA